MSARDLLAEVEQAGGFIVLIGDTLKLQARSTLPGDLIDRLRACKADVVAELRRLTVPRIEPDDTLRLPFGADPSALWWRPGGQSVLRTLLDLDVDPAVVREYLDLPRLEWLEERAAILEHDASMTRDDAEREAIRQLAETMTRSEGNTLRGERD